MAKIAKALGDPVRLQLVDVLRRHAGEAGIVESERQGLCAYYYVRAGALDELSAWLA
jgi:ArsR family transcriptional regulator, arsenate/arsenite/antimonite-responsive transcriptional repressor